LEHTSPAQFFRETLPQRLERDPEHVRRIGGVFEFVIEGDDGGVWTLDTQALQIHEGPATRMNCRIRISAADFLDLLAGRINDMTAFATRKLKVEGNIALSLRLRSLLGTQT
jgi:sterol carrier protein 2